MKDFHLEGRYHFFIIWPNGFGYINDILKILRDEKDIKILSVQKQTIRNMRDFVFSLYGCDSVPLRHLQSKLTYLFNLPPEVINIFVENFNPQEKMIGLQPFRKTQCQYIVSIKNKIRNLYNPKHPDPNFQILPLDKGVSHEHVIHASDCEEQVDYYLRLLGHKNGIAYLENDDEGLIFEKPFHVRRPKQYSFQNLPISLLLTNVLEFENGHVVKKMTAVKDTPHYRAMCGEMAIYKKYLDEFQFTYLCDDYSVEKFTGFQALNLDQLKMFPPILVKPVEKNYLILDGIHRASATLFHGGEMINCVVFEQ